MSRAAPILEVDTVSKSFRTGGGDVSVLREASLRLYPGEITSIIGPSGSGKTTMLMIAGLLDIPDEGEVRFRGRRISHPGARPDGLRELRRKHTGFVFQKANLIPFLTAVENVAISLEIGGKRPPRALEDAARLLAALGLEHRMASFPRTLSGGEQQRVAIARAFANDPLLLFADEPTAALDPGRAQQVMDLFQTLASNSRVAVCVVSHDLRWADYAQSVVVLEDGKTRISAEAPPRP